MLVYPRSSVAIKKGKSEGKTEFAHKESPSLVAERLVLENKSRLIVKSKNKAGRIIFRKETMRK